MRRDQRYASESEPVLAEVFDLLDDVRLRASHPDQGGAPIELSRFNRAILVDGQFAQIAAEDVFLGGPDVFDFWPVHGRLASISGEQSEPLVLHRVDTAQAKDIRGKVSRVMERMLRVQRAHIGRSGQGWTVERWLGIREDGSLVDIGLRARDALPMREQEQEAIYVLCGAHLTLEYSWTVNIGRTGSGFEVRIPTDSRGARRLLSLRDIPAGRERRAALRHWVTKHHRRLIGPEETVEVDVREHLRGAIPFAWEDFSGTVNPSMYDLKRNGQS